MSLPNPAALEATIFEQFQHIKERQFIGNIGVEQNAELHGRQKFFSLYWACMDIERLIDDIQQLEQMFEAPDIRPFSANTSLLRTEGTMKHSRTAQVPAMACAADLRLQESNYPNKTADT